MCVCVCVCVCVYCRDSQLRNYNNAMYTELYCKERHYGVRTLK